MTPERWQQVARVYQSALEQAPSSRATFLADACRDDSALRREVESLLAQDHASVLVDHPVDVAAAAVMPPAPRRAPRCHRAPGSAPEARRETRNRDAASAGGAKSLPDSPDRLFIVRPAWVDRETATGSCSGGMDQRQGHRD